MWWWELERKHLHAEECGCCKACVEQRPESRPVVAWCTVSCNQTGQWFLLLSLALMLCSCRAYLPGVQRHAPCSVRACVCSSWDLLRRAHQDRVLQLPAVWQRRQGTTWRRPGAGRQLGRALLHRGKLCRRHCECVVRLVGECSWRTRLWVDSLVIVKRPRRSSVCVNGG